MVKITTIVITTFIRENARITIYSIKTFLYEKSRDVVSLNIVPDNIFWTSDM